MGAALLLAGFAAGCAMPVRGTSDPGPATVLYVSNAADDTVTPLDGVSGRVLGPALAAGRGPWRVFPAANGGLLVLTSGTTVDGNLTHLVRERSPFGHTFRASTLSIGPRATQALLTGDGDRYAIVVYVQQGDPQGGLGCRLALIDTATRAIERTDAACSKRDVVGGLALERDEAGLTAFIATWWDARVVEGGGRPAGGRLLAVDATSGAIRATHTTAGVPGQLVLASAPGRVGRRLYVIEGIHGPTGPVGPGTPYDLESAERWQLVALNPTTLDSEAVLPLDYLPRSVAIAPDGDDAYALAGPGSLGLPGQLVHVHIATGATRMLALAPGTSHTSFAVTANRIYVPNPDGREVFILDRQSGRVLGSTPVGRRPVGITLVIR